MDLDAESQNLAHREPEVKGAVQVNGNSKLGYRSGTRDIGWHKSNTDIPDPLIGEIPNGKLWSMIRRFNKVRKSHLVALQNLHDF